MINSSNAFTAQSKGSASKAILWGGLIAGVLDITAAIITTLAYGRSPARMLRGIASGVLGARSFEGGLKTSALGLLLHFVIAFGATIVYYAASRKLTFLVRQAVISGILYGIAVYFFMQLVVIPLSAVPSRAPFRPTQVALGLIVHILCVGLPIALVVRHYSKELTSSAHN
ncbi:MAG TPA: hypothetical protein VFH31_06710 [Pyrinomonadaceae bacterium]|nr:hypothetical protein [Pyrinomonadaceae bacterium]